MAQNYNLGTFGQLIAVNTAANTATYNSAIVVGNSTVNVVINSSSVYVGGAPLTGTNTDAQYTWTNTQTFQNKITFNSNVVFGNATVNAITFSNTTGTYFTGTAYTANNATNLGGTAAASYQLNSTLAANVATLTANLATYIVANTGLVSNATGVYVNAAYINTISANLAYYIIANSGLVSNSLGVFVNTTYIGTLSANNSTNLNGQPASYYTNATNITTGTLPWTQVPAGTVNTSSAFTFTAIETFNSNVVFGNSTINATAFANTTNVYFTGIAYTANNSTNLNGQPASYYTNATNITTGTLPYAQIPANIVNTTSAFTFTAIETFNSNVVFGNSTVNAIAFSNTTGTYFTGTANNATNLGGLAAASYANTSAPLITTSVTVGNSTVNAVYAAASITGTNIDATFRNVTINGNCTVNGNLIIN